jgi:predicted deacylase
VHNPIPTTRLDALTAWEAGHAGISDAEDVDSLIQGCWNVARHLKMLSGPVSPVEHPLWLSRVSLVTSELDGVFYPLVGPEAYVSQGMKIGYVTDYFGKKVWDATSPIARTTTLRRVRRDDARALQIGRGVAFLSGTYRR